MKFDREYSYYVTITVIAICISSLALCGICWCFHSFDEPDINKVEIVIKTSGKIGNKNYISHEDLDSIIRVFDHQESKIVDKYQYFIDQKDTEDHYYSTIAVILGVVFSLFGFFGYKSVSNIEEKSIKIAEEKAEKTAKEMADKAFKKFLEEKALKYVTDISKDIFESEGANIMQEKIKAELYKYFEILIENEISCRLNQIRTSGEMHGEGGNESSEDTMDPRENVEPQF